ncbi:MAG TPA: hypothetical protein VLV82_00045 [Candidatus Angelobacter sp.]|nr:hypothetical protein [Candidatus Angelobacter sp.]
MTALQDPAGTARADLPRTERPDAPAYLSRYLERAGRPAPARGDEDEGTPLYLRRFRERRESTDPFEQPVPTFEGQELGTTRGWAEVTRTK